MQSSHKARKQLRLRVVERPQARSCSMPCMAQEWGLRYGCSARTRLEATSL